jgi:apolipoprotein N-acyltransferase
MLTRTEWRAHRTAFALCVFSGILAAPIFAGYPVQWLAWIVLVPLLAALPGLRGKPLVWGTYLFGFTWHYFTLFWVNTLIVFHPLIPVGLLLAAAIEATYFLAFTFPASFAMRRLGRWLWPWVVALLWTGMEYMRSFTDIALPWNYLGHSQVVRGVAMPLAQWADVAGVFGVTFFVALGNALLAQVAIAAMHAARRRSMRAFTAHASPATLVLAAALLVLAYVYANARVNAKSDDVSAGAVRVALIQPDISQLDKWASYAPETPHQRRAELEIGMIRKQFGLMQHVFDNATTDTRPRLFILPETAVTQPGFVYDEPLHRELHRLARYYGADIFFGADNRTPLEDYRQQLGRGLRRPGPGTTPTTQTLATWKVRTNTDGTTEAYEGEMAVFNSAWLVTPERGLTDVVYNKVQLVPFGETAPLVDMIPYFQEKVMMIGSFQKGLEFTIFETDGVRYGAMICFESAFGTLSRSLALNGAQMLVVLTNDAWYDPAYAIERGGFWGMVFRVPVLRTLAAAGPRQHYVHSFFRSVETRLPLLRVANTGISAIITQDGRASVATEFGELAVINRAVSAPAHSGTFYTAFGDLFGMKCLIVLAVIVLLQLGTHIRARRREMSGTG